MMYASINWKLLEQDDTLIFKGLAIFMIVMHNFMHEFPGPKENEFIFNPENWTLLLDVFKYSPQDSIQALFSFLGHFGVQIFIFISAYGLTKSFIIKKPDFWSFMVKRFKKVYPAFVIAILIWAIVVGFWRHGGIYGPIEILYVNAESLIFKLSLISNFIPGEGAKPVGPWWYIPFIFQFYLCFPLLYSLYRKWGDNFLIILSVLAVILSISFRGEIGNVSLYLNLLGHLPVFCFGMYFAKNDISDIRLPYWFFFIAVLLFVLGNIYEFFWYLSHFSFLFILIYVFTTLLSKIKKTYWLKKFILFLGSLSMGMFLVNGFLRRPFISIAERFDNWFMILLASLMFLLMSILVAIVLMKAEKVVMSKLSREL